MPASAKVKKDEEYWKEKLRIYMNYRNVFNNKPQICFLDDKLAFHIFADRFNLGCPDLLGIYYKGEYCDCNLDP